MLGKLKCSKCGSTRVIPIKDSTLNKSLECTDYRCKNCKFEFRQYFVIYLKDRCKNYSIEYCEGCNWCSKFICKYCNKLICICEDRKTEISRRGD